MSNVVALKKKAAEYEAKKQIDKAISAYREVLDAYDSGEESEPEIALYNRLGDLNARQGNTAEAVALYEQAVDLYTEGGFFNNAIALCNKVLRTSPGRASVYYKLGKISASKGFKGEAKQNFLEYADRMQKSGKIDEAFRALKEFADLVPDQDDVRLMLAEQLTKAGKESEALEQLQVLYGRHEAGGRTAEAQATAARMKAIDPSFEPKAGAARPASRQKPTHWSSSTSTHQPGGRHGPPRRCRRRRKPRHHPLRRTSRRSRTRRPVPWSSRLRRWPVRTRLRQLILARCLVSSQPHSRPTHLRKNPNCSTPKSSPKSTSQVLPKHGRRAMRVCEIWHWAATSR
ncbi:MAG: tetratricopeptide repeat protein [Gemmatimonadetes bacterium]|nr:tetratricopeptide repeat protein [Gemmatimonadota bacterium]